jgi:hypothetical protein
MKIIECEQGSETWFQLRAGVCTASRFSEARSKLSRASKNGSAGDPSGDALTYAWAVAIERINGKSIDLQFATPAMRRGTDLEPHARLAYELQTGLLASESGIAISECGKFAYSTDGLCGDDGLIEIKCPAAPQKIGAIWSNPEEADAEYIDQIQGGMWVTGRQWCDLVVYCPWLEAVGKDLFIKRIKRDESYISALEADLIGFSKLVDRYEEILRAPSKFTGL